MVRFYFLPLVALWFVAGGCNEDLEAVSQVTKFRLLAVQATPPEILEDQGTVLRVLLADPGQERNVQILWLPMTGLLKPTDTADAGSMQLSWIPELHEITVTDGEAREWAIDEYTIPANRSAILEKLPEDQRALFAAELGETITVFVLLCAGGELSDFKDVFDDRGADDLELEELCVGGESILGTKTVQLFDGSDAESVNHNPEIIDFQFDKRVLEPFESGRIGTYKCRGDHGCRDDVMLEITVSEASFETYEVEQFGEFETLDERLYVSWFISGGKFDRDRSGFTETSVPAEAKWLPPYEGGAFTLWAVLHDVRGGVSWQIYSVKAAFQAE